MNEDISFKLNGETISVNTEAQRPLLWVLRTNLALKGTKYGLWGRCLWCVHGHHRRQGCPLLRDFRRQCQRQGDSYHRGAGK
jgi:hypothetical protein